ncbi:alpha/beta fold hydrolase [Tateyamaria sp. syn59]|uniref:alpha/beta fold hydrolase n=1 Tax=Tateyamaria sp. syn59 TaxID=2576942 RepID=UPI0011BD6F92|nr:alpha/beta hydrolase [Tateyamaria sp. syn59]
MFLHLNGARIFFDTVGPRLQPEGDHMVERPTLLVLHGGPGFDHSTLRPYFDRFADAFQVVFLDHRGCGRSDAPQNTWHLDQWADDIADFCTALGIEKPLVFGQSFGGMVAMHYAARHPDHPARLILSSTAARFLLEDTVAKATELGGPEAGQIAHDFFSNPTLDGYKRYGEVCLPLYSRTIPTDGASFRNRAIEKPEVNIHFFANEMMGMDLRPQLAAISCPTLVLGGVEDPVTPTRCSEEIAAAIGANARLELFENCGHGVHRDDPEGAERMMRAFLTG